MSGFTSPFGTRPVVVKLGGRALDGADSVRELADDILRLTHSGGVAIVHGGGGEVTDWCQRLGIEPRFHAGLRVTDEPTLEVATAVLAGLANKRLVASLRAVQVDAIGLAGLDGGIVNVRPHPEAAALGAVGAVESVATNRLELLLSQGAVPVLASIGDHQGRLLNLNADDLAAAIAPALGARALLLLSDTEGLKLDGAIVPALDRDGLDAALAHPDVQGGMGPKLKAARAALEAGVESVVIAAWQGPGTLKRLLAGEAAGTTLTRTRAKEPAHG